MAYIREGNKHCYKCDDCGLEYDWYDNHMIMLNDKVWLSFAKKEEALCDGCIEKRLGREVKYDDLALNEYGAITPLNNWYIKRVMDKALIGEDRQLTIPDVSYCSCIKPDLIATVHPLPNICNYCRKAIRAEL